MKIADIIDEKNHKKELNYEKLSYVFNSYLNGSISDDEMALFLKSVCKNGLSIDETKIITTLFIESGDVLKFEDIKVVDKHSTGGVGDKVTLILVPVLASLNIAVAKMSGRALGHTGGTIDKLESIPNFRVSLSIDEFVKQVKDIKCAITSQTGNLVPMDKKVYALRDVTKTVSSLGLIASSIMSKKIASGAKSIYLDIKIGSGALIDNKKDAYKLAKMMIDIGKSYHRKVICFLTNMDIPLGNYIGNRLEVIETIKVLSGEEKGDLYDLVTSMAIKILMDEEGLSMNDAKDKVYGVISSGKAQEKFKELICYQGGNLSELKHPLKKLDLISDRSGYIKNIDSLKIGNTSMMLGAGRLNINDKIDYDAGIILRKNVLDYVKKGDVLCSIYGSKDIDLEYLRSAFKFSMLKPKKKDVLYDVISG